MGGHEYAAAPWLASTESTERRGDMKRRVFVSDVHMSTGNTFDWLTPDQASMFSQFLDYVADQAAEIDELILVGDIMDDWVCPVDVLPKRFPDIGAKQPDIMERLKKISQKKTVTYVTGNHDMTITKDSVVDFGNGGCTNIVFQEYYDQDGILAQHGHQYGMYNAYDPMNQLPIGHYISRLYVTRGGKGRWQDEVSGGLRSVLAGILNPFVNAPLNYLAQKAGIDDDHRIVKVDGGLITLGGVKGLYADLTERWERSHGALGPMETVLQETPAGLNSEAKNVATKFHKKVIIFGHTHVPEINYVQDYFNTPRGPSQWSNIAVYANCGSWCEANAKYTYVVDEYDETADPGEQHRVTLMVWPEKEPFQDPLTV
jgi:UDP-2,3-diacylglucosamine pyrophosphatase LpxH